MSNAAKNILNEICKLLETYRGRDKLIGALHSNKVLAQKFLKFSKQMSMTRATLRLLDDLPMLKYNLEYGFGSEEPDRIMASLGVTANVIDQIFYPIEKMSWLAETGLISTDGRKWDVLSSVCWVSSIYLGLLKSLRYVSILEKHKMSMKLKNDESVSLEKILFRRNFEVLTCTRLCLDFVHSVNTLPKGFLWSSKLNNWQIGVIASLSSFLGIYQIFYKRNLN